MESEWFCLNSLSLEMRTEFPDCRALQSDRLCVWEQVKSCDRRDETRTTPVTMVTIFRKDGKQPWPQIVLNH